MNVKKLLLHERVEVRQFEEGLKGSWHPGVVVGVSELRRSIEYDELLSETGHSKLIESIPVTEAIEGLHRRCHVPSTYRGHIRPLPSQNHPNSCKSKLNFGVCVDVHFEDAWWEGVIFDGDDDSNERFVYFPDEGDERKFSVSDLRVSCVWDEYLGQWRERGVWTLVGLANRLEGGPQLSHFIKRVWVRLRSNYGFIKMVSEWTCSIQSLWSKYFREVVDEIAVESTSVGLNHNTPACLFRGGKKAKISQQTDSKSCLYSPALPITKPNDFNHTKSTQNKNKKTSLDQCNIKKQSLNLKLRSNKHRHLGIEKANENSFQAYSLRGRNQLAAGNLFTRGATAEGKYDHLSNGCGCRSKEKLNTFPPTQTKRSLKKNYKAEKQKLLITREAESNQLLAGSQSGNRETTIDASLLKSNKTGKIKLCKSKNDYTHQNKRKMCRVSPSKRRQQLVQKSSALKKSNPIVTYKHKINRHAVDSSRMVKEAPEVSYEQEKQPFSKRRFGTKLKQTKNNVARRILICKRRQSHKEASCVAIKQRNCSISGKRIAKRIKKSNGKVKARSKEDLKVLDAIQTQDDISASWRNPRLNFVNSGSKARLKDMVSPLKRKRKRRNACSQMDPICIICQDGGELILCDHCPTSYHVDCIHLKDVPDGTWFCPLCCCGLCGLRNPNGDNQLFTDVCHQCSRQYHLDCLSKVGENPLENFCSKNCFELCQRLHQLLGISYRTSEEGLTWKMIRSTKNDCDSQNTSKIDTSIELSRALEVMHECFQPVIEPHTKRDLVHDVIFNSVSKLRRLDFRGFYVMVLQKGSELVSVATIRIHGKKVAEMPLIATPFDYRRQGMCRLLVQELEKMLTRLGVERIVLPAITQLSETWKSSFGFSEMSIPQRLEFINYPFLCFYGTKMFQKSLSKFIDAGVASQESGGNNLSVSQEYEVRPHTGKRFFGLCYNRKPKRENTGKENMDGGQNGNVSMCKYVYKRRRILANK